MAAMPYSMRLRKADAVVHVHAFYNALVMWLCACVVYGHTMVLVYYMSTLSSLFLGA